MAISSPDVEVAAVVGADGGREGADQHDALDADVEHAALLDDELAVGRPEHGHHQRDPEREDSREACSLVQPPHSEGGLP